MFALGNVLLKQADVGRKEKEGGQAAQQQQGGRGWWGKIRGKRGEASGEKEALGLMQDAVAILEGAGGLGRG